MIFISEFYIFIQTAKVFEYNGETHMSLLENTINSVTGSVVTDFSKWLARKVGNTELARGIEERLNPDQLHPATRDLLDEALKDALKGQPKGWKNIFKNQDNRLLLIEWVMEGQDGVVPDLDKWNMDNQDRAQLTDMLLQLYTIIQQKKRKHFPLYFFNLLANQIEMLQAIGDLSKQLDEHLSGINALLKMPASEKDLPKKLLMTLPPRPYFFHTLDLAEHFTGRQEERGKLTKWMNRQGDIGNKSVLVLRAIGGMGKSSVAWVWVHKDVAGDSVSGLPEDTPELRSNLRVPEDKQPEGILWYSFYEGGGTFKGFLDKAIAYCSDGERTIGDYTKEEKTGTVIDYGSMQEDLKQLLQQRRFLFVWDGAERLLREYACIDAEMREEREPDEIEPEARDIADPATRQFLKDMASQSPSRILLTSRLYPRDLENLSGTKEIELTGLGKEYSVAYLRVRGIQGNRDQLESAAEQYEFHPLSLSNLVADLREDFEYEGDIEGAPKYDETENLKARQHHILERAYERRAPHRQELLSRMAAMRGTIPRDVIRLLAEDIAGLQIDTLGKDLGELVRHGLLRHPSSDRWDFHPVVRRYCLRRLKEKETIHRRLMGYYKAIRPPDKVTKIEDLTPTIELYHHTVRAGLYDEAFELFRDRLSNQLYFQFGAYHTRIELLRALFPDGEDHPPRLKNESAQAWTLNELATDYSLSGQSRRAVPLFEMQNALQEKADHKKNIAIGLGNLAYQQVMLGELKVAEGNLRRKIELRLKIKDEFDEAVGHRELGRLLVYEGAFSKADSELATAEKLFNGIGYTHGIGVTWAYHAISNLLMNKPEVAIRNTQQTLEFWEKWATENYPVEHTRIECEWLLGWSKTALASEKPEQKDELLSEAEFHLTEALTRCRRINNVEHEPDILLAWARWHRLKEKPEALEYAEEALSIADRCEYRLKQADIHNFLAQLGLDDGDRKKAKKHAEIAKERAYCDGPPHYYKPAYEEAERLLKETGK